MPPGWVFDIGTDAASDLANSSAGLTSDELPIVRKPEQMNQRCRFHTEDPASSIRTPPTAAVAQRWPSAKVRLGYAVAGTVAAVMWASDPDAPAWMHLVRTGIVMLVAPPLLVTVRRVYGARARRAGHPAPHLPFARFLAAKALLVLSAFALQLILQRHMARADVVVAVAIFTSVDLIGPLTHGRLIGADVRTRVSDSTIADQSH